MRLEQFLQRPPILAPRPRQASLLKKLDMLAPIHIHFGVDNENHQEIIENFKSDKSL